MATHTPPAGDDGWRGQVGELANGTPIEVDPRDLIGAEILRSGAWESETAYFVLNWLRPGMTVVDAGAHVGFYTLLASAAVGPAGRVIAFEPHPVLGPVLRRNVSRAGCENVTVSPMALGRAPGTGRLVLHPPDNFGASSLRPDEATAHLPWAPVEVTTLDEALARLGGPAVDLAKIDVEGAELDVIDGARRTLAANPGIVLIVEFLRENPLRFGRTVEDLEVRLRELGFQLFALTAYGPRRYDRVGGHGVNVVAVRHLTTLLGGLPEPLAARTLLALARTRGSAGKALPEQAGHPRPGERGAPVRQRTGQGRITHQQDATGREVPR
jgi:FkbM family methyltransferase